MELGLKDIAFHVQKHKTPCAVVITSLLVRDKPLGVPASVRLVYWPCLLSNRWLIINKLRLDDTICSAVQSSKSWVTQRTIHDRWLVVHVTFGWSVYDVVNELLPDYKSQLSKLHTVVQLWKILRKFISRETDYSRCNYGSPVPFMGHIWRLGDSFWTALYLA